MDNISNLLNQVQVELKQATTEQNFLAFFFAVTEVIEDSYSRTASKPKSVKDLQKNKINKLRYHRLKSKLENEMEKLHFTVKYFEMTMKSGEYLKSVL